MPEGDRVLIVGAGPVGLSAALALASREVPVTVLEAEPALSVRSKASTFHPPTLDMLAEYGIADELVSIGVVADRYQIRDRREGKVAEFDLGLLKNDTAFPFRVQVEQHHYTPLALERLDALPNVDVRFATTVLSAQLEEHGVTISVQDDHGVRDLHAAYLVGADGARSVVRRSLGVAFEGMTYPERYLVTTTTFDYLERLPDLAYVNYVADPAEFFVLLRLPEVWRTMVPIPPSESEQDALSDASIERRLQGIVATDSPYPIVHRTLYHVHQRVAERFRVGRALLAGDAAHVNNPLGGMGMNSGVQDAFDLGRRLAEVFHGRRGDDALDDYARLRREVAVRYTQRISHENVERIQEADPTARRRYYDELRRMAADPRRARDYLLQSTLIEPLRAAGTLPLVADRSDRGSASCAPRV